ncbi:MAG: glycosyltransferase family 39 protein [Caldiserica bacterium]|nr:glycosyltransferase family 39 protein [Caldisericota bacterium]
MSKKTISAKGIISLLFLINLLIGVGYLVVFQHDKTYSSGGDILLAGAMLKGKGFSVAPESAEILKELQAEKGRLVEYPELMKEIKKKGVSLSYLPYVDQPPGLPSLMLVTWKISHSQRYLPLQILQLLVSIGMVFLIYKTGENFFSYRSGLIASFVYTFWLPLKRVAVAPHRDFWGIAFTLFWIYFLSLYWKRGQNKYLIAGAAISGIGTYFQPTIFLLPFFSSFMVLFLRKEIKRKFLQVFLITFLLPFLIVSPWIVRNRLVYHRWILM